MTYKSHPLLENIPMLNEGEFEALKNSIKLNGQNNPILKQGEFIISGRHRYKACIELGIEPLFKEVDPDNNQVIDLIIAEDILRRHMTLGQRVIASMGLYDKMSRENLSKVQELKKERRRKGLEPLGWQQCRENTTCFQLGKMLGVGVSAVMSILKIRRFKPELLKEIQSNKISINKAMGMVPKMSVKVSKKSVTRRALGSDESVKTRDAFAEFIKTNEAPFKIPSAFDSYEIYFNEFLKRLSDTKRIGIVVSGRQWKVQVVDLHENFITWGNTYSDADLRRALLCAYREHETKPKLKAVL